MKISSKVFLVSMYRLERFRTVTREQPSNIATRVIIVPVAINMPIARYLAHLDVTVAIYHFVPLLVNFRCTD